MVESAPAPAASIPFLGLDPDLVDTQTAAIGERFDLPAEDTRRSGKGGVHLTIAAERTPEVVAETGAEVRFAIDLVRLHGVKPQLFDRGILRQGAIRLPSHRRIRPQASVGHRMQ